MSHLSLGKALCYILQKFDRFRMLGKAAAYRYRAIAMRCWTSLWDMAGIMPCYANVRHPYKGMFLCCKVYLIILYLI